MGKENDKFVRTIRRSIVRYSLFDKQDKIIAAVSGGVDSMTMIEVLCELREEFDLMLAAVHVNYGMRGIDSDRDEQLVREYAGKNDLPVFVKKIEPDDRMNISSGSFQERARNIRYIFFEEMRRRHGFDLIATGHTADDNAETVFMNLLRGGGLDGLRGIPPKRDTIIRPLIGSTRTDIESYASLNGIPFRVDASNLSDRYARNIIRNEVFPLLRKKLRVNVRDSINQTGGIIAAIDDYLQDEANKQAGQIVEEIRENEFMIDAEQLRPLHPVIAKYILRDTASRLTGYPITFDMTFRVYSLLDAPAGSRVILSSEYRVERESSGIRFHENTDPGEFAEYIEVDREYRFDNFVFKSTFMSTKPTSFEFDKNTEYVDAGRIYEPVLLRSWNEGDRMQPLGMRTFKKISDVFIDEKIPRSQKKRIPIVECRDGIVWICGVRLDDRFKITDSTKHVLRMEYIPHASR